MLPIMNELLRQHRRQENLRFRRKRRSTRRSFSIDDIPEARFKELFRINKIMFRELRRLLAPFMVEPKYLIRDVSVEQKILVALRFYATGCYQRSVGQDFNLGVSQTCVHRYIHEVTTAIEQHISENFIKFPTERQEINRIKQAFMDKFHFPGVVGIIDGSHIAILKPTEEGHNFLNRKGFYSLNMQIVCDHNLKILSINANYPGASHDSFVWRNSELHRHLHNEYFNNNSRNTWLIGDSGYPLEPVLLTPFANPAEGSPQERYNNSLTRARNSIERCIGVLKTRFRCLLQERVARYNPRFVGQLAVVCATLHNMCLQFNVNIDNEIIDEIINVGPNDVHQHIIPALIHNEGQRIRNNIVNNYFWH